jgi:hypothetical protein
MVMAMGLPDFFGQNRIIPGQGSAIYQQMLQQYQQNQSGQIATTVFINVSSEEVARRWDVAPNNTVYFVNVNEGYIYIKSAGSTILEPGKFTKFRLIEENENEQIPQVQESEKPQVNMDEYMKKSDFEPYKNIITEMQDVAKELKG